MIAEFKKVQWLMNAVTGEITNTGTKEQDFTILKCKSETKTQ